MTVLDDMALFARVVEAGSFSAAAAELDSSRSSVSKRIKALEERLGTRLLNRTTRRLSLTESGEIYFGYCRAVRTAQEEAERRLGELAGKPQGRLRVSLPVTFGELHVAPLLGAFMTLHPAINLDVTMEDRFVDLVEAGLDLAIRVGHLPDSGIVVRRLADSRLLTCAAPRYLARHGRPRHPSELRGHNCLTYRHGHSRSSAWEYSDGSQPLYVNVAGTLRCDNGMPLRAAARAGAGIARLPDFMLQEDLATGRLVEVLADYPSPLLGVHAVFPHPPPAPLKTQVFVDFLRSHLVETGIAAP